MTHSASNDIERRNCMLTIPPRASSPRSSLRPAYIAAIQPSTTTYIPTQLANGIAPQPQRKQPVKNPTSSTTSSLLTVNTANTENGLITHASRSAVPPNALGLSEAGNTTPRPNAAMMESNKNVTNPTTPAAAPTGPSANNDGSHVFRTPALAYSVPSADLNPSLDSLAIQYTNRLAQSPSSDQATSTMFPSMANPYDASAWFAPDYPPSSESTSNNANSAVPSSPWSAATQTLVDNFAFPDMTAPAQNAENLENLDFTAFFGNQAPMPTAPDYLFSPKELEILFPFGFPAPSLPCAPVNPSVMDAAKEVEGKGKEREQTPVVAPTPLPKSSAPAAPEASKKRSASEVDGAEEEAERSQSDRVLTKREQNRQAAARSRARKVQEQESFKAEISELKEKVRQLEAKLQTVNAENRVLREYSRLGRR